MAQSRTAVNATAGSGDAPGKGKVNPSLVPGQSINDLGGPTNQNEKSTDDSTKIDPYKGSVGQVKGDPQQKGASAAGTDGGAPGPGKGKIGKDVLPNGQDKGKAKVVEHQDIEDTANEVLDELGTAADASDDFKAKAKVIFESALNQKLKLEVERLEEEFSTRFEAEIAQIAEKVEGFLNYTSEQWLQENKLVVENGIKNELSESFMQGLRSLFEDHYVTLPDEKYDVFESMVAKLDDMENKLNEQIEANVALASSMSGFQRQNILSDVSWDLSEAGKEKMAGLAESVEFESEDTFRQKLEILKESFAGGSNEEVAPQGEYLEESAEALAPSAEEGMTASMAAYARALGRTIK